MIGPAVAKAMADRLRFGSNNIYVSTILLPGVPDEALGKSGVPKRSRTSNRQIRSLVLYPIELWAHYFFLGYV